jgi:hypothetical protein
MNMNPNMKHYMGLQSSSLGSCLPSLFMVLRLQWSLFLSAKTNGTETKIGQVIDILRWFRPSLCQLTHFTSPDDFGAFACFL